MRKISVVPFVVALIIPLLVGGISAAIASKGMSTYGGMDKPPLSPSPWVFSVAWTILYIMMGMASYYIYVSEVSGKSKVMALTLYGVQLAMNFMWSIVFFNWQMYLAAFIWLIILWCLVITLAFRAYALSKGAAYLLTPYILWLTFAAYLNMGAFVLSRKA